MAAAVVKEDNGQDHDHDGHTTDATDVHLLRSSPAPPVL